MAALLVAVALGAALVVFAWRGKRVNDHPICRDCGFDLESIYPEKITCPECGAGLKRPKGVRIGARRKRWMTLVVGLLLIAMPTSLIVAGVAAVLTGSDIARYTPVGVLLLQGRYGDSAASAAAAKELMRRESSGTLSAAQLDSGVQVALDIQEDLSRPWSPEWGDLIETASVNGTLSDSDKARFQKNAAVIELECRPKVSAGGVLPVRTKLKEARIGSGTQMQGMVSLVSANMGSRKLVEAVPPNAAIGFFPAVNMQMGWVYLTGSSARWGMGTAASGGVELRVPKGTSAGAQTLGISVKMTVQPMGGMISWMPGQTGPNTQSSEHRLTVEVLPQDLDTVTVVEPTNSTTEQLEAMLNPRTVSVNSYAQSSFLFGTQMTQMAGVSFQLTEPPAPIAHRVFMRNGDREWELGPLASGEGLDMTGWGPSEGFRYISAQVRGFDEKTKAVDLVFRPDPSIAPRTLDMESVYGGELVVRNVEVETEHSHIQTTTTQSHGVLSWLFGSGDDEQKSGEQAETDDEEGIPPAPETPSEDNPP